MPQRTYDQIWWPFVQHGTIASPKDVTVIDSASSDFFSVYSSNPASTPPSSSLLHPELDGSASWWTQTFGHGHPRLAQAVARAAGRYGHVMFPQATHAPALKLAERLLKTVGKGWASRVFFSDNGSTGMEVAVKMALRAYVKGKEAAGIAPPPQGKEKKLGILGLKGSYHGDTGYAMSMTEKGVYTCEWHDEKGTWLQVPRVYMKDGLANVETDGFGYEGESFNSLAEVYDLNERYETPLRHIYTEEIERYVDEIEAKGEWEFAALVLEPLILGAGGMVFVDPLFQLALVESFRHGSTSSFRPVIFDEVFAGLYRAGEQRAGNLLGVNPDISVHAKVLTGGVVPLATTLASSQVFDAFVSDNKADALLHGHSYTAHAVGCEVANETLDILEQMDRSGAWDCAKQKWQSTSGGSTSGPGIWSLWDPGFINEVSKLDNIAEVMALGTVLAIKLKDNQPAGEQFLHTSISLRLLTSYQGTRLS